jgi:hypothetical protein
VQDIIVLLLFVVGLYIFYRSGGTNQPSLLLLRGLYHHDTNKHHDTSSAETMEYLQGMEYPHHDTGAERQLPPPLDRVSKRDNMFIIDESCGTTQTTHSHNL